MEPSAPHGRESKPPLALPRCRRARALRSPWRHWMAVGSTSGHAGENKAGPALAAPSSLVPVVCQSFTPSTAICRLPAGHALQSNGSGPPLCPLTTTTAAAATRSLGGAQFCLDAARDYVKGRHQFGRAIGDFQARVPPLPAVFGFQWPAGTPS